MSEILSAVPDVIGLLALGWIVVVGSIGAALGASRANRPLAGFLISVFVPVPVLGWLIVIGLTDRRQGRLRRAEIEPIFTIDD